MEENFRQLPKEGATDSIKIALFGPESTGKTTLAIQLSEYYKTVWVPEFARDYLQQKLDNGDGICQAEDMLPIAYGQMKLENEKALIANKYLFCDTTLMVTKVFSEMYYNFCDPALDAAAKEHQYDLFFLTAVDVPWENDGLRDNSQGRESVFEVFKKALLQNKKPFITLSGNKETRLIKAIAILNDLAIAQQMGFSSFDYVQIYEHGISIENIQKQLAIFKNGISKSVLISPATLSNGIMELSDNQLEDKSVFFDTEKFNFKLEKFVPASGAASRMFKFLNKFLHEFDFENESINAYINRKKASDLSIFIIGLEKFPFFKEIDKKLHVEFPHFDSLSRDHKNYYFIKTLLGSNYFDFANKPKAILPFHEYQDRIATPIEEHLYECAAYSTSNKKSNLHFTISEAHQINFESIINTIKKKIEDSETTINVSYSYQNKSTDTIAVDLNNNPFRNENGELVFRPGGHGALIENLNNLHSDIIFIKNIDNVILNHIEENALYKKALAGILIELQKQIFQYLNSFESQKTDVEEVAEILVFLKEKLNIEMKNDFHDASLQNKKVLLKNILNRPIRVCGMVKNEGEPGGGPFWVKENESVSLQIVEASQVDLENKNQRKMMSRATHFNPVDLVCGIKNYKNEKFNLTQFIDPNSGFIVEKNVDGMPIKGYELPGLWNGAMANWLTVFVQVPLLTFNPVKTVNDLLKPAHQPQ